MWEDVWDQDVSRSCSVAGPGSPSTALQLCLGGGGDPDHTVVIWVKAIKPAPQEVSRLNAISSDMRLKNKIESETQNTVDPYIS